ncbi:MAG: hypothetical protein JXR76_23130 [Deltaproteobacteria bacterium]|nr:hypothetical protein [Deltaproteobacteria bacterium]
MNSSTKSLFKGFQIQLNSTLLVLTVMAFLELLFHRLLTNMGFYVGVGTEGVRASIASFSIFTLVFAGSLAGILLLWAVARLLNHPHLHGNWWRGILIFISPIYLLSTFWSIWTPLSDWVLLGSLIAVQLTVLLLCILVISSPVTFGIRRFFGLVAIIMLVGATKWIALDFFQINRLEKWGAFLLNAFEVVQFFMVLLPFFAFRLFVATSSARLMATVRRPHWPALILSSVAAAGGIAIIVLIQQLTEEGNWLDVGRYVMRISYLTIGLKLAWPMASIMTLISLFFLGVTCFTLIIPSRHWQGTSGGKQIGFGLALIYLAGIQPYTVYQMAISLLGVLLLVIGVADLHPERQSSPSLHDLQKELED